MATPAWSSVIDALKEDYKDEVEQLPDSCMILAQLEHNSDDVQGRRARHVAHISRNSGVGARDISGGATLPTAGRQGWKAVNIPVRGNYVRVQFPRSLMQAMRSDRGSFVRGISVEMDLGLKDSRRDLNRQVWGTSDGVIATCGVTAAANVVVLATTTTLTQLRQIFFEGGGLVDIGTVANPVLRTTTPRNVTAIDEVNLTITIDGAAITTAGTDRVFRAGAGGASTNTGDVGDGQKELTGLQTVVSTTTILHTIDPASVPIWKSRVYNNPAGAGTNRAYSEQLVNRAIHRAESESGELIDLLCCNFFVQEAIAADMKAMRRNMDTIALKGGYSGIAWGTAGQMGTNGGQGPSTQTAIVWENDCPQNRIYGLATSELVLYQMGTAEWADDDGSTLSRVPNQDEFEAYLAYYGEVGAKRRNAHFVVNDLTEPA
jgi:hypothetical protein